MNITVYYIVFSSNWNKIIHILPFWWESFPMVIISLKDFLWFELNWKCSEIQQFFVWNEISDSFSFECFRTCGESKLSHLVPEIEYFDSCKAFMLTYVRLLFCSKDGITLNVYMVQCFGHVCVHVFVCVHRFTTRCLDGTYAWNVSKWWILFGNIPQSYWTHIGVYVWVHGVSIWFHS